MSVDVVVRVAERIADTGSEGPGRRFAIWVQGCPLACQRCCNPHMFADTGGMLMPVAELLAAIRATPQIDGITLLGGEPVEQAAPLARLAQDVRDDGRSVMMFSGYTWDELQADRRPGVADLLAATDLLVAGRYDHRQHSRSRRWVGSANQTIHALSERYQDLVADWPGGNSIELRLRGGELLVNGFPAPRIGGRRG